MNSHQDNTAQIIVFDPGLREHGGHHPAFIMSMLDCEVFRSSTFTLKVFANREFESSRIFASCDPETYEVVPFFDIDYYHYFYAPTTHLGLPGFLQRLGLQYLDALTASTTKLEGRPKASQTFFFHTLGWEHASALADALYLFEKQTALKIRVVILLMFSPYSRRGGSSYDQKVYLKFVVAFKRLASYSYVKFFACDYETSKAYEYILERKIEVSPLPFTGYKHYSLEPKKHTKQIILYLGDTKATKGFLLLPTIVKQIVEAGFNDNICYVIQFTLTNRTQEFVNVANQLKILSKVHKKILVYNEFWPEDILHKTLSDSSVIMFNYDDEVYQFQSSGVLWLAVRHNLKILFLSESWLSREAERLNCEYVLCNQREILNSLVSINTEQINKNGLCVNIESQNHGAYGRSLFGDFSQWLRNNLSFE